MGVSRGEDQEKRKQKRGPEKTWCKDLRSDTKRQRYREGREGVQKNKEGRVNRNYILWRKLGSASHLTSTAAQHTEKPYFTSHDWFQWLNGAPSTRQTLGEVGARLSQSSPSTPFMLSPLNEEQTRTISEQQLEEFQVLLWHPIKAWLDTQVFRTSLHICSSRSIFFGD